MVLTPQEMCPRLGCLGRGSVSQCRAVPWCNYSSPGVEPPGLKIKPLAMVVENNLLLLEHRDELLRVYLVLVG